MVYTIPDPAERVRLLPDVYARMIRFGFLAGEVYVTAGELEGVALWMPPNHAFWCQYAMQYIAVSRGYGLPVDLGSSNVLRQAAAGCPTG